MPDKFSKEVRSRIMSSIRAKDTKPEMIIRKILWAKGKRYRLHDRSVFGTPDICSKSGKVAVFIDGCFWHGCARCYQQPKTNAKFWKKKILDNKSRRKLVITRLREEGWKTMEIWEHEIKSRPHVAANKISKIL